MTFTTSSNYHQRLIELLTRGTPNLMMEYHDGTKGFSSACRIERYRYTKELILLDARQPITEGWTAIV